MVIDLRPVRRRFGRSDKGPGAVLHDFAPPLPQPTVSRSPFIHDLRLLPVAADRKVFGQLCTPESHEQHRTRGVYNSDGFLHGAKSIRRVPRIKECRSLKACGPGHRQRIADSLGNIQTVVAGGYGLIPIAVPEENRSQISGGHGLKS